VIRATISLDDEGLLRGLVVEGHSGYASIGSDIVCAAVTAIVRSTTRVIGLDERFRASSRAEKPGRFEFSIDTIPRGSEEYLSGITNVLVVGLGDVSSEFPERCSINVKKGA
jgi:uncharacterized protein